MGSSRWCSNHAEVRRAELINKTSFISTKTLQTLLNFHSRERCRTGVGEGIRAAQTQRGSASRCMKEA
ncbi:unnamed protein product [Arctogadus glacialis]